MKLGTIGAGAVALAFAARGAGQGPKAVAHVQRGGKVMFDVEEAI